MTRVAAIDQGTNSTRLLVADVADGRVDELHRETRITRLGEGVDERRRLLPLPVARVRNVLTDYRRTAERLGAERTLLVATSAVRDAENGEAFLGEVEWSYGFATRLVSGDEEAQLTLRGIATDRRLDARTLVLDIGGGSTELVLGAERRSIDVGSVRLTERYGDDVEAAAAAVRAVLPELEPRDAVGVAGTITTIAALDLELEAYDPARVHGHVLSRDGAERQLRRLAALDVDERRRIPALDPDRAPVIVGGAVILVEVLRAYGLDAIEASERDLLDGIALEAAELPQRDAPAGVHTCC